MSRSIRQDSEVFYRWRGLPGGGDYTGTDAANGGVAGYGGITRFVWDVHIPVLPPNTAWSCRLMNWQSPPVATLVPASSNGRRTLKVIHADIFMGTDFVAGSGFLAAGGTGNVLFTISGAASTLFSLSASPWAGSLLMAKAHTAKLPPVYISKHIVADGVLQLGDLYLQADTLISGTSTSAGDFRVVVLGHEV